MRKVIDILNELPEPYRSQAFYNTSKQNYSGYLDKLLAYDLKELLKISFRWAKSPEGFDYWNDLYNSL